MKLDTFSGEQNSFRESRCRSEKKEEALIQH